MNQRKETLNEARSTELALRSNDVKINVRDSRGFFKEVSVKSLFSSMTAQLEALEGHLNTLNALANRMPPSEARNALLSEISALEANCQPNLMNANAAKSASRGVRA